MCDRVACKSDFNSAINVAAKHASFVSVVKCYKDVKYWGRVQEGKLGERITDLCCQETLSSCIRNIHEFKKKYFEGFPLIQA
jgi:hypothetical protein